MPGWSAESQRNRRAGQMKIRRRCTCGLIISGNVGWWSHTHRKDGTEKPEHKYKGRA